MLFILLVLMASFVGIGTLTQVIIPRVRGQPVFPRFRRESLKQLMAAKQEFQDAENALAEAETRNRAAVLNMQAAKLHVATADLDMNAYEIRENMLDGKIGSDRQLAEGAPEKPVPSNGAEKTH